MVGIRQAGSFRAISRAPINWQPHSRLRLMSVGSSVTAKPASSVGPGRKSSAGVLLAQSHFWPWIAALTATGFALRVLYTFTISPPIPGLADPSFYYYASNLMVQGHGYTAPFVYQLLGQFLPTSAHPPLWPALLAVLGLFTAPASGVGHLTGASVDAARILGCAVGAGVVLVTGLLGRRIGGWRVGLVAAAIAAVYPHFITLDGFLMSEPLYGLIVGGLLLLAYDFTARPTRLRALALGVLVGLAALTREEALLFVPVLLLPVAWRSGRERMQLGTLALVGVVLVIAPWTVRNYYAFHRFVPVSNGSGAVVAGSNCARTYYGSSIGSWQVSCVAPAHPSTNEAVQAASEQSKGLHYIGQHPARAVLIAGVRFLRMWSLYAPNDQAIGESTVLWIGLGIYYCLMAAAIYALVMLRRRGRKLLILLAPAVVVAITSLIGVGLDRLRYDAEIPMIALAAWTVVLLLSLRDHRSTAARA
jgi:4-amino-4-deoxy-L-arabinose transferase-like glycosyltransferase